MRSTFYGLEIAKTGLFVSQNSLDITAHNIANVNSPGYTRQRLYTAAMPPAGNNVQFATDKSGTAGRGVTTVYVEQIRNPFLDYQYRKENTTATTWQSKEQYFGYVESLFNSELADMKTQSGISSVFSDFYRSLYKLSEEPSDSFIRSNLQQSAIKLTETMNYYYQRLEEQQITLDESVKISVDDVNNITTAIARLNEQIFGYELSGERANDLRDQRNLLMDELSGIVKIDFYEDSKGYMNIQLNGKTLVRNSEAKQLKVDATMDNPMDGASKSKLLEVYWVEDNGSLGDKLDLTDGAIKAYMDVRDGNSEDSVGIPYIIEQLNNLCQKIARDVNEVHRQGFTLPNGTNASRDGVDFFFDDSAGKDGSNVTAKNFKLSNEVRESIFNIAASDMEVASGDDNEQRGNGKNALKLSELINKTDASGNNDNLDSAFKTILTGISSEMKSIKDTSKAQSTMRSHVDSQRKSISNVSLDEEITNVVKFGHAYNAASRVISAMDEQLDILINKMGMVGR